MDQALARMFPEYSRSRLKAWILDKRVDVDGELLRPRDPVDAGATVEIRPPRDVAIDSQPEPMDLQIAYQDDSLLIVNKPAGLVVHPGAGNHRGTLMNGLLYQEPALAELPRAGIVHRLDKDTSGLLIVARTLTAHTALVRMLANRQVSREYLAVCVGVLTGGGTIDAPIGRHPVDRTRMHVREGGKPAVSHYRVIKRFASHTAVSVSLETGRTHQIRVHFAYRRHPLVGDPTYGARLAVPAGASAGLTEALRNFRRQALHAQHLAFTHPVTGEPVSVHAEPPQDLAELLRVLEENG